MFLSLIHFTHSGPFLALHTFAFASPHLRLTRLLTDITDAKKDSLECSYSWTGQGRITRHLLCLLAYFHSKSKFRLQDNPCPNKSLGISTAFVKGGQANKIFFIFTYNVLKISRLPPTLAVSSDFCVFISFFCLWPCHEAWGIFSF